MRGVFTIGIDHGAGDDMTAIAYQNVETGAIVVDILRPGRVIEGECVRIEPVKPQRGEHGRLE